MSVVREISEENQRFFTEAFPRYLRILWLRVGAAVPWWNDFETADLMGWTFREIEQEGNPTRYIAYRDSEKYEDRSMEPLLLAVLNASHAEWHTNPEVAAFRKSGWKCKQAAGLFYLQLNERIEPIYVTAEAAWAALARSQA